MTGLKAVEQRIQNFHQMPIPGLEEGDITFVIANPKYLLNKGCRVIADSTVNSGARLLTMLPTTIHDIGYDIVCADSEHLKDGAVAIPRALGHVIVDATKITGVVLAGAVYTVIGAVMAAGWATYQVIDRAPSLEPVGNVIRAIYSNE